MFVHITVSKCLAMFAGITTSKCLVMFACITASISAIYHAHTIIRIHTLTKHRQAHTTPQLHLPHSPHLPHTALIPDVGYIAHPILQPPAAAQTTAPASTAVVAAAAGATLTFCATQSAASRRQLALHQRYLYLLLSTPLRYNWREACMVRAIRLRTAHKATSWAAALAYCGLDTSAHDHRGAWRYQPSTEVAAAELCSQNNCTGVIDQTCQSIEKTTAAQRLLDCRDSSPPFTHFACQM